MRAVGQLAAGRSGIHARRCIGGGTASGRYARPTSRARGSPRRGEERVAGGKRSAAPGQRGCWFSSGGKNAAAWPSPNRRRNVAGRERAPAGRLWSAAAATPLWLDGRTPARIGGERGQARFQTAKTSQSPFGAKAASQPPHSI